MPEDETLRSVVDVALEESDRDEQDIIIGPTYLLRFHTVRMQQESVPSKKKGGKTLIRESERRVHVGTLRLEPSGHLESDLRSATLHGLLALDVFPLIEDEKLHLGSEGGIERLLAACEAAVGKRFVIERVEVDDDDDALARLRESTWGSVSPDWGGQPAPWAPLPLRPTRHFIDENPNAQIEIIFPTVYEEDRSKKIQDLATGEGLKVISHRRMAEQMAKELQQEQYDYDEEQEDIQLHPSPVSAQLGQPSGGPGADALLKSLTPGGPEPVQAEPAAPPTRAEMAQGSRPGMDAASRADFRRTQRAQIAEAVTDSPFETPEPRVESRSDSDTQIRVLAALDELRMSMRALAETVQQRPIPAPVEATQVREAVEPPAPQPITITPPAAPVPDVHVDVHVPPAAPSTPPDVHVHVPRPRRRQVEYDEAGRIIGIVDVDDPTT